MTDAEEVVRIAQYVKEYARSDSIPEMENDRDLTIAYEQRVGEILNQSQHDYSMFYEESLGRLLDMEQETETTRKAKLEAWTADNRLVLSNLKVLKGSLKAMRMSLMQSIKTRRDER